MSVRTENENLAVVPYRSPLRPEIAAVANSRAAKTAREALTQARRIAIVTKFRFMGDTVVATPFFTQLKRAYPQAEITLLTAITAAAALENCPAIDHFLPMEKPNGQRLRHIRQLHSHLRQGSYDTIFLLNRSFDSAVIALLAGIRSRIGYISESRGRILTLPIPYTWDRNEVDAHLDMLRALGLSADDALPELWISETEQRQARTLLAAHGWDDANRPLIGIQPGANDPQIREWGAERYARTADALIEETGGRVVLMGGAGEAATAAKTAAAMRHAPVNLVGKLQLREALAVIGQCNLWVGNDSGLLHAAVSQRVASVGLFGPNKVARWGYDTPRHRSLVVFPETPADDDAAIRRALDAISEDTVLDAARQALFAPKAERFLTASPYFAAKLPTTRPTARRR